MSKTIKKEVLKEYMKTITITFGDQAENHVGMQKIGQLADSGFTNDDLKNAQKIFESKGATCEYLDLNIAESGNIDSASILIIRQGTNIILNGKTADDMYNEQNNLNVDTKAFMYGRVVNKHARHNLCFDEKDQEPNYAEGKGRIIAYNKVPLTKQIREKLGEYFGLKANNLTAEGNYYYDIKKCGIGFHGDSERKKVIAVRLGATLPLHYQWFYNSLPVGQRIKLNINHGDIYIMGEKATGCDWKTKKSYTLRHAAGCEKYLTIN